MDWSQLCYIFLLLLFYKMFIILCLNYYLLKLFKYLKYLFPIWRVNGLRSPLPTYLTPLAISTVVVNTRSYYFIIILSNNRTSSGTIRFFFLLLMKSCIPLSLFHHLFHYDHYSIYFFIKHSYLSFI